MKYLRRLFFVLFFAQATFAQFTIHVLSPWKDDNAPTRRDSLRMEGNAEVNYYPGTAMSSEGGGWFYYTYTTVTKTSKTTFKLVSWIGPEVFNGRVYYGRTFRIDSLFAKVPATAEDIWVIPDKDTTKFPAVYAEPPESKVINLYNPWPESSPKIIINGNKPIQMRIRDGICGWYRYFFVGPVDSLKNVTFTDYFQKQIYSSTGMSNGTGIDLTELFSKSDTVYILPKPFPAGAPAVTNNFPNKTGNCNTRKVSGIFRDWKLDEVSFFNNPMGASSGSKGMVMPTLTAPDYKLRLTDDPSANTLNSKQLESWFKSITFPNGKKNDTCIDLIMTKDYDGRWIFDSDKMGGFFPLDDFNNPNNIKYLNDIDSKSPTAKMHNFHFTMEMHMQFVYREGLGLQFDFKGDDDVWIFVNNILAIDLGGLHERATGSLNLDKSKDVLKLVNGQVYNMDIFYAERNPVGSNLFIKTSMDLRNSGELYYKDKALGPGKTQYDIWQQVESEAVDCGLTRLSDGEELSNVNFYIEGPQFTSEQMLKPGKHYGGIIVDENKYRVTIDSASLTDLIPGDYKITFISTTNSDRTGYLLFTVYPIPDHLDLIPDSVTLDTKKDMSFDSLIMGTDKDSISLYAVIRDIYGTFMENATALTWKSSNEEVLTITPSKTDKSKAMITKVDGGTAWVIVSQEGLKPDSIFIHAEAKPTWPLISSAVMYDSHGDLRPDLLNIALSDTFKTGQVLSFVEFSYNGNQYKIPAADCQLSVKVLKVPFKTLTGQDGTPSGTVTIVIDVNGKERRHSNNFSDGVGPALISASVLEKDKDEPDILYLTFSESVKPATLSGSQLLLIKEGTTDTLSVTIQMIQEFLNDSSFSVVFSINNNIILPGDKLRLLPGIKGGTISDLVDNNPHELNIPVVVNFKKGAAPIVKAWYKDTYPDGILDSLMVQFNRSVDISELDEITIQWAETLYKIKPDKFSKLSDSVISIPIQGTVVPKDKISTSGAMFLSQKYKSVSQARSSSVIDSAAPVLISAKLYRGEFTDDGSRKEDTLHVTFSENCENKDERPFILSNSSSDQYKFVVSSIRSNGTQHIYLIKEIEPTSLYVSKGDSIWINKDAGIGDNAGVAQRNELNRRVILDIIQPPTVWLSKIGPNPQKLPGTIKIKVLAKKNIDLSPYHAKILIYDALNNTVADAAMVNDGKAFNFNWDGHNLKGRAVGAGTYISILKVFENDHQIWTENRKIGIKR